MDVSMEGWGLKVEGLGSGSGRWQSFIAILEDLIIYCLLLDLGPGNLRHFGNLTQFDNLTRPGNSTQFDNLAIWQSDLGMDVSMNMDMSRGLLTTMSIEDTAMFVHFYWIIMNVDVSMDESMDGSMDESMDMGHGRAQNWFN
jgi:hypothetical protein